MLIPAIYFSIVLALFTWQSQAYLALQRKENAYFGTSASFERSTPQKYVFIMDFVKGYFGFCPLLFVFHSEQQDKVII